MSAGAAIAAVTTALRNLLADALADDPALADTVFTTQPPDLARTGAVTSNQLNMFLYRTSVNAAWSNQPLPGRVRPGEDAPSPLALTLSYLLTAYGRDNDIQRPFSHLLLGRAMSVLHDHPVLTAEALRAALPPEAVAAGAPGPVERVRLTMQPMSLDELGKLWSSLQSQLRLSAAYEASVVLIESSRAARTPLPVLRRGESGAGITMLGDATSTLPLLVVAEPASASIGDTVILHGRNLAGAVVRLTRDGAAWDLAIADGSDATRVLVTLPGDRGLGAGIYAACVVTPLSSNAVALALAPRITSTLPLAAKQGGEITLDVSPPVQPGQRAAVLVGSAELAVPPRSQATGRLAVPLGPVALGRHVLRIRVDGVDSASVRVVAGKPPEFDPAATLTVTS